MSEDRLPIRPSYAQFLTTASTLISIDRIPSPWFSSEVRESSDPRIQWIDLSEEEIKQKEQTPSTHKANVQTSALELDEPDEAIAGHYLNHIDTVQERDHQKTLKKKNKRRSRQRSVSKVSSESLKSSPPQEEKTNIDDKVKTSAKSEAKTASEAKPQSPKRQRSRRRKRPSRKNNTPSKSS